MPVDWPALCGKRAPFIIIVLIDGVEIKEAMLQFFDVQNSVQMKGNIKSSKLISEVQKHQRRRNKPKPNKDDYELET